MITDLHLSFKTMFLQRFLKNELLTSVMCLRWILPDDSSSLILLHFILVFLIFAATQKYDFFYNNYNIKNAVIKFIDIL